MSNIFRLRFKPRRTLAVVGAMLGIASLLIAQVSLAATGPALDTNTALRVVNGPGASNNYVDSANVQDGNVVEVASVIHNAEPAGSGSVANNVTMRWLVPRTEVTTATIYGEVDASNNQQHGAYVTNDNAKLNTANGRSFTINNIGSFKLQRNHISDPNEAKFNWDGGETIPNSRIKITDTPNYYEIIVQPTANGELAPCFGNALKLSFLMDVNQKPVQHSQLKIEKKVRIGNTSFVDENTATVGQKMQYFVELKNITNTAVADVTLRDALPKYIKFIPGSVQIRSNGDPNLKAAGDNFLNGGYNWATFGANAWVQVYFNAEVLDVPECSFWQKNFALVKTKDTGSTEYYDSVKTTITKVCVSTPTPTPTPTPETPTPTPTPTPETPTPTPTPSPSETPGSPVPSSTPPSGPPTEKGSLPKTGAATAGTISLFALGMSGYLYLRERRALKQAVNSPKVD